MGKKMRRSEDKKVRKGKSVPDAFLNIIGQNTLQNELLLSFLKKETGLEGKCFPTLESIPPIDENEPAIRQLLLLDCKSIDMKNLWENIVTLTRSQCCPCLFVLFNVVSDSGIEKIAMDKGIQGIFYNNDPIHSIPKGICAVLKGDLWYSRKTLKKMLKGEQSSTNPSQHPAASCLTPKEKQVLSFIASGHTSKDIAGRLEISVHTFKTHVCNIYKKINVNDRLQASLWASKFL